MYVRRYVSNVFCLSTFARKVLNWRIYLLLDSMPEDSTKIINGEEKNISQDQFTSISGGSLDTNLFSVPFVLGIFSRNRVNCNVRVKVRK